MSENFNHDLFATLQLSHASQGIGIEIEEPWRALTRGVSRFEVLNCLGVVLIEEVDSPHVVGGLPLEGVRLDRPAKVLQRLLISLFLKDHTIVVITRRRIRGTADQHGQMSRRVINPIRL